MAASVSPPRKPEKAPAPVIRLDLVQSNDEDDASGDFEPPRRLATVPAPASKPRPVRNSMSFPPLPSVPSSAERVNAAAAVPPGDKFAQHEATARAQLSADLFAIYLLEWKRASRAQTKYEFEEVALPRVDGQEPRRFPTKAAFDAAIRAHGDANVADVIADALVYARPTGTSFFITGFLVDDARASSLTDAFRATDLKLLSKIEVSASSKPSDRNALLKATAAEHARSNWVTLTSSSGVKVSVPSFDPRRVIDNAIRRWQPKNPTAAAPALAVASAEAAQSKKTQKKQKKKNTETANDEESDAATKKKKKPTAAAPNPRSSPVSSSSSSSYFTDTTDDEWAEDSNVVLEAAFARLRASAKPTLIPGLVSRQHMPEELKRLAGLFPAGTFDVKLEERERRASFPVNFELDMAAIESLVPVSGEASPWETLPVVQALLVASNPLGWLATPGFDYLTSRGVLLSDAFITGHLKRFEADDKAQVSLSKRIAQLIVANEFVERLATQRSQLLFGTKASTDATAFLAAAALAQSLVGVRQLTLPRLNTASGIRCALTGRTIHPGESVLHVVLLLKPVDASDLLRNVPLDEVHCIIGTGCSNAWCHPMLPVEDTDDAAFPPPPPPHSIQESANEQQQPPPPPQLDEEERALDPMDIGTHPGTTATSVKKPRPPKTEEQKQRERERAAERRLLKKQQQQQQQQQQKVHEDDDGLGTVPPSEKMQVVREEEESEEKKTAPPPPVRPKKKKREQVEKEEEEDAKEKQLAAGAVAAPNDEPLRLPETAPAKKRQRKASKPNENGAAEAAPAPRSTLPSAVATGFVGKNAVLVHLPTGQLYWIDGGAFFHAILALLGDIGDTSKSLPSVLAAKTGLSMRDDVRTIAETVTKAFKLGGNTEMLKSFMSSNDAKKSFVIVLQLLAAFLVKATPASKQALLEKRQAEDPAPPEGLLLAASEKEEQANTGLASMIDMLDELYGPDVAPPRPPALTLDDVYYVDPLPIAPALVGNGTAEMLIDNMEKARAKETFGNAVLQHFLAAPSGKDAVGRLLVAVRKTATNDADAADITARILGVFAAIFPTIAQELAHFVFSA